MISIDGVVMKNDILADVCRVGIFVVFLCSVLGIGFVFVLSFQSAFVFGDIYCLVWSIDLFINLFYSRHSD